MREKLIELLESTVSKEEVAVYGEVYVSTSRVADHLIANDVVPVVRCKDCKWWHDMKCTNINGAHCLVINKDWFCCSGERKEK